MFVILVYNVQAKRVSKIRRIVKKYLSPVQESVFEGHLTESLINSLKYELQQIIEPDAASVILYRNGGFGPLTKEQLGHFARNTGFII